MGGGACLLAGWLAEACVSGYLGFCMSLEFNVFSGESPGADFVGCLRGSVRSELQGQPISETPSTFSLPLCCSRLQWEF